MLIGDFSCKEFFPILYWMAVINIIVTIGISSYIVYLTGKLLKDNGILAKMLKNISSDLPN